MNKKTVLIISIFLFFQCSNESDPVATPEPSKEIKFCTGLFSSIPNAPDTLIENQLLQIYYDNCYESP